MQAIRQIVKRESIKSVLVPESFGENVEIVVLPVLREDNPLKESKQFMKLQEQTGFAQTVLADNQEDVWNDI